MPKILEIIELIRTHHLLVQNITALADQLGVSRGELEKKQLLHTLGGITGADVLNFVLETWVHNRGKDATLEKLCAAFSSHSVRCKISSDALKGKWLNGNICIILNDEGEGVESATIPVANVQMPGAVNAPIEEVIGDPDLDVYDVGQELVVDVVKKDIFAKPSTKKGYVLIINNIKFANPELNRDGAERDSENLEKLFSQLNYTHWTKSDVKSPKELAEILKGFKTLLPEDKEKIGAVIVFICSHGNRGQVSMTGGEHVDIYNDIVYKFNQNTCPKLEGIPKLFFIQACQGNKKWLKSEWEQDSATDVMLSDTLVAFSTLPGYVSYRNKIIGSRYIFSLVNVVMEHACNKDLLEMLPLIQNEMCKLTKRSQGKDAVPQLCHHENIGFNNRKFWFFFPETVP